MMVAISDGCGEKVGRGEWRGRGRGGGKVEVEGEVEGEGGGEDGGLSMQVTHHSSNTKFYVCGQWSY